MVRLCAAQARQHAEGEGRLQAENAQLAGGVRRLTRDVARLEAFKRNLLHSLQAADEARGRCCCSASAHCMLCCAPGSLSHDAARSDTTRAAFRVHAVLSWAVGGPESTLKGDITNKSMCTQGPQEEPAAAAAPFLHAELAREALVEDALQSAAAHSRAPSAFSHRCYRCSSWPFPAAPTILTVVSFLGIPPRPGH